MMLHVNWLFNVVLNATMDRPPFAGPQCATIKNEFFRHFGLSEQVFNHALQTAKRRKMFFENNGMLVLGS